MSKTPEEMAEEYANSTDSCDVDQEYAFAYKGFLAGYKAAQDQVADASKVMNSPNNSDGWISVKERLPVFRQYNQNDESGYTEDVLMCFVWGRIRINNFEKVDGIVTTGHGNNLNEVTHWMPLPEAPKEEK